MTSVSRAEPRQCSVNVADLLLTAARQNPTSGLYLARAGQTPDTEFMSYPALLDEAQRIAGGLHAHAHAGNAGRKIALLLDRPRDFILAFWACICGGYVPCPLALIRNDPERWARHVDHVDALLDRPLFVTTGRLSADLPESVVSARLDSLRASAAHSLAHSAQPSDAAIVMLTSGSTGNSKAVELTHASLLASMIGRARRQRLSSAEFMFNWIAFDHVAALLESHMIAVYVSARQLHTESAAVLTDPLQFLRLVHRHRITIAFAPNFLLGQINAALEAVANSVSGADAGALDLSCLRRIVTGGEANVVATGRRFLELLAPYGLASNALWPAFGMTETCAASVYSHDFPEGDAGREFASVGSPIDGLEIRIVGAEGSAMPAGECGELQVRGPVVFRRYYNNDDATRDAFTVDGWFRTGDLGRIDDHRLSLVARSKDSIVVSGVNYFSHELETRLEQLEGVERSFVAAFPVRPRGADTEQLAVTLATTVAPENEDDLYRLIVAVRNTTIMLWGFRPAVILPLSKSAFPKTSLGKIQRSVLRRRFEAGEFAGALRDLSHLVAAQVGPYAPAASSTEAALIEIFADILRIDRTTLSATASFFDLGGTSLDILRLMHALDDRFKSRIGSSDILQHPTARQLATLMAARSRAEGVAYDPVVPLQVTGKNAPLFCVHPGNSEVLVLVNLAKYFLNDRPFYALRPPGFRRGQECFKTLDEIVTTYIAAILVRQPHGPFFIAGYSLGFTIAFEIAKALEARGEEVAFLGCIDWQPHHEPIVVDHELIATGLAYVLGLIDYQRQEQLRADLVATPRCEDTCRYILQFAAPERLAELNLDLDRFSIWARVAYSMERLLLAHVTSGTLKAPMSVFCSAGFPTHHVRQEWRRQLERWTEFVPHAKYVDVPGDHYTLMFPRHVAKFQALLRTEISRRPSQSMQP